MVTHKKEDCQKRFFFIYNLIVESPRLCLKRMVRLHAHLHLTDMLDISRNTIRQAKKRCERMNNKS